MPAVKLEDALLELDEARATDRAIQNTLDYGTDDPTKVAALEAEMFSDYFYFDDDPVMSDDYVLEDGYLFCERNPEDWYDD